MILGLGSDVVDIRRIADVLDRHGERFLARVFTAEERRRADRRAEKIRVATYAKRFAAKEAASKALGTGFRAGVFWRDLGVVNLPSGQPTMLMTGGARERLAVLTPAGMVADVALTMTDEFPYAQAMVIISARALP
jgi:holo-[acyl-carrier protein] synthase